MTFLPRGGSHQASTTVQHVAANSKAWQKSSAPGQHAPQRREMTDTLSGVAIRIQSDSVTTSMRYSRMMAQSGQASQTGEARLLMTYHTRAVLSVAALIVAGIGVGIAVSAAFFAGWNASMRARLEEEKVLLNNMEQDSGGALFA